MRPSWLTVRNCLAHLIPGSPEARYAWKVLGYLSIWGIGAKRFEKHGKLMLAALAPLRSALEAHAALLPTVAAASSSGPTVGEPHPDWRLAQQRPGLYDGPWRTRRAWCAEEMGRKIMLVLRER